MQDVGDAPEGEPQRLELEQVIEEEDTADEEDYLEAAASNKTWKFERVTKPREVMEIIPDMIEWVDRRGNDKLDANDRERLLERISPPIYVKKVIGRYEKVLHNALGFSDDMYSPWAYTTDKGSYRKPRYLKYEITIEGVTYYVRSVLAAHPTNQHLLKHCVYIDDMKTYENVVYVAYIHANANMTFPPEPKPRLNRHNAKIIRSILREHGTKDAPKHLVKQFELVPDKKKCLNTIRKCTNVEKESRGKRKPVDYEELKLLIDKEPGLKVNMIARNRPGEVPVIDDDLSAPERKERCGIVEACYINRDAVRTFVKFCPHEDVVARHLERMEVLRNARTSDHVKTINSLKTLATPSMTMRNLTSVVQADTTFDMCDMYVTLVTGMIEQYRTATSKKCRTFILAAVFHPKRSMDYHSILGDELSRVMCEIDPTKRVMCTITDGEAALSRLFKGPHFSTTQHLRCEVHIKENVFKDLKKKSKDEKDKLWKKLMGEYRNLTTGEISFFGGLMSKLNREDYDDYVEKLKARYEDDPTILSAITKRVSWMYDSNSMYAKLCGGFVAPSISTNCIESMNARLKKLIPCPVAQHLAIAKIIGLIKNDVKELFKATMNESQYVVAGDSMNGIVINSAKWNCMTHIEKKIHVNQWGLPERNIHEDPRFPNWVKRNQPNIEHAISQQKVWTIEKMDKFYVSNKTEFRSGCGVLVDEVESKALCGDTFCKGRKDRNIQPCRHIAAIICSFAPLVARKFWIQYQNVFDSLTSKQLCAMETDLNAGAKMNRKGYVASKHNKIRQYNEAVEQQADVTGQDELLDELLDVPEQNNDDDRPALNFEDWPELNAPPVGEAELNDSIMNLAVYPCRPRDDVQADKRRNDNSLDDDVGNADGTAVVSAKKRGRPAMPKKDAPPKKRGRPPGVKNAVVKNSVRKDTTIGRFRKLCTSAKKIVIRCGTVMKSVSSKKEKCPSTSTESTSKKKKAQKKADLSDSDEEEVDEKKCMAVTVMMNPAARAVWAVTVALHFPAH